MNNLIAALFLVSLFAPFVAVVVSVAVMAWPSRRSGARASTKRAEAHA